jgi:IS6 family transposase
MLRCVPMFLKVIAEKLKRQSKDDFKGRRFEAWLIVQAVTLISAICAQLSNLEEMFGGRGFKVDHGAINRWVLAYAALIDKRLCPFRRPHFDSGRALRQDPRQMALPVPCHR